MKSKKKEYLTSYALILLIILSLVQVGILWDIKSLWGIKFSGNEYPAFLFNKFFTDSSTNEMDKSDFFMPYKIIASEGINGAKWLLEKDDIEKYNLWGIGKSVISSVITSKPEQIFEKEHFWNEVISNRTIIYEFRNPLKIEVVSWFLNRSISKDEVNKKELKNIYKIAIELNDVKPDKNYYNVFVNDDTKVLCYYIEVPHNLQINNWEYDIFTKLKNEKDKIGYNAVFEYNIDNVWQNRIPIENDVLICVEGDSFTNLKILDCTINDVFKNDFKNRDKVSSLVAGEKLSYNSKANAGLIVWYEEYYSYKVYKSGIIDYQYLPKVNSKDVGLIEDALAKAIEFIKKRKTNLVKNIDIYLSNVKTNEDNGYYEFDFDYMYMGKPIVFSGEEYGDIGKKINNSALTIKANGQMVIKALWNFKNFSKRENTNNKYYVKFEDLLNNRSFENIIQQLLKEGTDKISDISLGYFVNNLKDDQVLEPMWIINLKNNNYYVLEVEKR